MINFFRRIRQQLLSQSKFSKYLLYAIGEIILVVIGILIALQINNWNEGRKNEIRLKSYLVEIQSNLVTDVRQVNEIIEIYMYADSLEGPILHNKVTFNTSKDIAWIEFMEYSMGLQINTNGFDGFIRNADNMPGNYTPIMEKLNLIYNWYKSVIDINNDRTEVNYFAFQDTLKSKAWYLDYHQLYSKKTANEAMHNYFLSDAYKKEVVFRMNDYRHQVDYTHVFKVQARRVYVEINKLLGIDNELPVEMNVAIKNPDLARTFKGHYTIKPNEASAYETEEIDILEEDGHLYLNNIHLLNELIWVKDQVFYKNRRILRFDINEKGETSLIRRVGGIETEFIKNDDANEPINQSL